MSVWQSREAAQKSAEDRAQSRKRLKIVGLSLGVLSILVSGIFALAINYHPYHAGGGASALVLGGPNPGYVSFLIPDGWESDSPVHDETDHEDKRVTYFLRPHPRRSRIDWLSWIPDHQAAVADGAVISIVLYHGSAGHKARMRHIFEGSAAKSGPLGRLGFSITESRCPAGSYIEMDGTNVRAEHSRSFTCVTLPSQFAEDEPGDEIMVRSDSPEISDNQLVEDSRFIVQHMRFRQPF